jgi:hypothetical protein
MFKKEKENNYDECPVYYVYHIINPIKGTPFYVGKGKGPRCFQHLTPAAGYTKNKRLTGHIKNLRASGIEPMVIKISVDLREEDAYNLEEQEIIKYGRIGFDEGGTLLNIFIANRPERMLGERNGFYGKKHSEETKRKLSKLNTGKKHSEKSKRLISEANRGKPKTEEHRQKIREKARGRYVKEETKQKLREYNLQEDILRKNIESKQKEWIVITPEGTEEFVINLSEYCITKNISRSKMYSVAAGRRNHHKGYKCRKVESQ